MQSKVGTFKVVSGKAMVSDPCYKKGDLLLAVKNGDWNLSVNLSDRVTSMMAETQGAKGLPWETTDFRVGVDSGLVSIFDNKFYRNDKQAGNIPMPDWMSEKEANMKGSKFYGACCYLYQAMQYSAGVLPNGCVATSGYGDGVYPVMLKTDKKNNIVGIKVKF